MLVNHLDDKLGSNYNKRPSACCNMLHFGCLVLHALRQHLTDFNVVACNYAPGGKHLMVACCMLLKANVLCHRCCVNHTAVGPQSPLLIALL